MVDDSKTRPGGRPIPAPPKSTAVQKYREVGVAALAAVPAFVTGLPIGGLIGALLNAVIGQPNRKQGEEWIEAMGETVRQLVEERGLQPEDLAANPTWQNAARRATEAAMKDARHEKWETLRHALMNATLPGAPPDDLQHIFFRLIDEFSPTHVRMLRFCMDPIDLKPLDVAASASVPLGDFIRHNLPQPSPGETVIRVFLDDLDAKGLVTSSFRNAGSGISTSPRGRVSPTDLGRDFLRFIAAPPPPEPAVAAPAAPDSPRGS